MPDGQAARDEDPSRCAHAGDRAGAPLQPLRFQGVVGTVSKPSLKIRSMTSVPCSLKGRSTRYGAKPLRNSTQVPGVFRHSLSPSGTGVGHLRRAMPPAEVAVGDPAALLQRRPDVRAAERQLASATAKIGVAEAAKFPRLSFMGLIGIGGSKPGDLFDLGNISAIAAPQLSWNFLDFGRNAARVGQAEGARDEAAAQYRGAVLGALRDAEDSLSRYAARRLTVASAARSLATADRSARLMRQRFDAGTATLIDVLDAERQRVSAEQALSQATAAMTADYVALQKALGLGWSPVNTPRS